MHRKLPTLVLVAIVAATFAACHAPGARPRSDIEPTPIADVRGATRYQIDAKASELHVLVYRGGAMARLGHNHVVSSKALSGKLYLQSDFKRSSIELGFPVNELIVDEPASRTSEGEDFAAEVPQEARDATRHNLLRAEVLDGDRYPTIKLRSAEIAGTRTNPILTMRVTIKEVSRNVSISAHVSEANGTLTAVGQFAIKQTDFGITPFSVALGALQVQDELRIRFSIVCRQQQ
jgi:hypothetical protein